jgi:opacity protein-like surface antigen
MKKQLTLIVLAALLLPGLAAANTLTLRMGYYIPQFKGGVNSLWDIEFTQMSFSKSSFYQGALGASFDFFITKHIGLTFAIDSYNKTKAGAYRDYVGVSFDEGDFAFPAELYNGDFSVSHLMSLSMTPIQASLKIAPLGRRGRLVPYFGGGVGLYIWKANLWGDQVDFSDEWIYTDPKIGDVTIYGISIIDTRQSNEYQLTVGYQGFAGLMFPIGSRLTLEGEVRYHSVKGKPSKSFEGFEDFDLGGLVLSVGINYWF